VAFRLLLMLPHVFALYFVGLAAGVVMFIGWWGALFTGRLPQFAVDFTSGYLRWLTRINAYQFLLTDVYPPFALGDVPAYPVRTTVPAPQQLNRAAVFFRFILAFPAAVLVTVLALGSGTLLAFIAWLVTLIAGRLPASLHLAYVAVLRFHARFNGYWWMLTPAYPGGLYGDKPGAAAWADALAPVQAPGYGDPGAYGGPAGYGNPGGYGGAAGYGNASSYGDLGGYGNGPGYGNPGYGNPAPYGQPAAGYGTPGGYDNPGYGAPAYGAPAAYGNPGYGAPVGYGAPGAYGVRPVFQPATWLLPLTSAARKLMTVFIALGSLLLAGYVVVYSVIIGGTIGTVENAATSAMAVNQLNTATSTLSDSLNTWKTATAACDGNLTCVTQQDGKAASAFSSWSNQVADIPLPADAITQQATANAVARGITQDFTQLSQATTAAQYQSTFNQVNLQQALSNWETDVDALLATLQNY
jgi:hypothetical protein